MTWFSLPVTQPECKAAFSDAAGASAWLAQQPLANAAGMQAELSRQILALNGCRIAPRERFKTLDALRKALFTVDVESQRRFENRPIPLWSSEQAALDASRRLWRSYAVGYLHCLRACLDGDPEVAELRAKIAHRALVCLRMEQQTCYLGALDVEPDFWRNLHAILAAAEQMGVAREPVSDRLLGETSESTISGQYAMTLLLHLARPFELSRSQFAAATRWLARWREQAEVSATPDDNPKSRTIALDLSLDRPTMELEGTPGIPRWLAIDGVLRKMRKRVESLQAGESPESLKLGSGISSEACIALLKILTANLRSPLQSGNTAPPDSPLASVATGLENIYNQLGGKRLKQTDEPSSINRREQEQIAIFGQVARATEDAKAPKPESWRVVSTGSNELRLFRPAGKEGARLSNKCLIAVQLPGQQRFSLASIYSLCTHSDGTLHAIARMLPGEPAPLVAEIGERPMGKISRHPAFILPAMETLATPSSVLLPAGASARALSIKLQHPQALAIKLLSCIERGSDYERWDCETS